MSGHPPLPFTGERFTPECVREIWYEHWHRYAFASRFARGKRVLDAACGEGYGSALLSRVAADVLGVDVDPASIEHARTRYGGPPNLRYEQADATSLPHSASTFDLVVSFETLEHLAAQEQLVAGFARSLTQDGLLLISSPDKRTYSDQAGFRNEFHVRELYREELLALLAPHFPFVRLYGQKLLFQSALWALDAAPPATCETLTADPRAERVAEGLDYAPLYFVAVCSRQPLSAEPPALSLFGDGGESVYTHYNHEIRKGIAAGERIAELEAELERLRARGEPASKRDWRWWRRKR
jgi:SAM-dependent methyltransferase